MNDSRVCSQARLWTALLLCCVVVSKVEGQTDYYNLDTGRPATIEDAYATERYAFELQVAPVRLERAHGSVYNWSLEPEIAYGIFPRTQLEIGLPILIRDTPPGQRKRGVAGLEVSLLHNLNAETYGRPAFAVAGELVAPVGGLAPDDVYGSLKGIATRSQGRLRFHLNGEYTFGSDVDSVTAVAKPGAGEINRWLAGLAVDRAFALRSFLVIAEVFARQSVVEGEETDWTVGTGVRYQLTPYLALDGGLGKTLTGDEHPWFFTLGVARAFALRSLMPR